MVQFKASRFELSLISQIADRAATIGKRFKQKIDRVTVMMDLDATHSNGCALDLNALLQADDANFIHDVFGIMRHIDRKTGKLGELFSPRFRMRERRATA